MRALLTMYPGRMAALCAAVFPFWFLGSTALQFQSKFLQSQHGYGPGQVALLFVLGGLFAIVGNAVAGSLSAARKAWRSFTSLPEKMRKASTP